MKKWLSGLAFLLAVGVPTSQAQFYSTPIINPYVRSGTGPNFSPYGVGYGNTFGGFGGLGGFGTPFGGGFGSPYGGGFYGPMIGNVGGLQPGGVGFGNGLAATGAVTGFGTTGIVLPQSGNVTGHPTRFNAYSQYFNNQGNALLTNVLTSGTPAQQNPAALGSRINSTVGVRPPQRQGNPAQQP